MTETELGLSTRDVGERLDSLQPYFKPAPGKVCVVKGCKKRPRIRVFYGSMRGHQDLVGVCPEHVCDIVNGFIDANHPQGAVQGV